MDVDRTTPWTSTLVKKHDENKTYILVKLSESFSNAIQEYSAPTIKFHGSRGAIKFQNGKSYDFSLEQSDNSVECIKQIENRWESVGKMACCLHVKGKDDVYQRTRTKMEAAEQEKRKYCTKLLGSPEHQNNSSTNSANNSIMKATTNHSANNSTTTNHNHHHQNHNHNNNHHHHHNRSSRLFDAPQSVKSFSSLSTSSSLGASSNVGSTAISHTNAHNAYNSNNYNNSNSAATDIKSSLLSSSSSSSASSTSSSSSAAPATSTSSNNNNNYVNLSKYPDITDVKQLKRYKAEFDKDYKEYQNLHGYLHRIEEKFKKLKELLKQSVEGSPEWESTKEEIFNEYERVKGDSNFHRARSKYKQLYNKLAHIKEKIFQFKREHRDKCNTRKKRKR